ncbi:hypothetical protein ACLMJK_002270 [Lecanora helva]
MSSKRKRSKSPDPGPDIFKSSPIVDRSSKFIGFYSPCRSAKELQSQGEIQTAMHRMAAWRCPSNQRALTSQTVLDIGHDDDGEKYGGKTLEKVLSTSNIEGSVVVARWYGGVLLGPVRFDHIRACAQEAISGWAKEQDQISKKQKIQEDAESRQRLVTSLPERDKSIIVLRGLLAEKRLFVSHDSSRKVTPSKVPDYANLPLTALEKLEQARDATIAWILGEIEKAESAQTDTKVEGITSTESNAQRQSSPEQGFKPAEKEETVQNQDVTYQPQGND